MLKYDYTVIIFLTILINDLLGRVDKMSQYTGIAEVYDRLIDMDYDGWENFLVEFFNKEGFSYKGKKCLELGCGTGNMTLRLKKIGFEVYGMDISEDMMCVAQEKLMEENLRAVLLNQDMTDFSIDKSFSCIFSFCDGYNYITDENKLVNSFKNVYSHLNDGGYFIFDVSSEYKLKNIIGSKSFTLVEDDICYIWDNFIDGDIIEMYITFFVKKGNLYKRIEESHIQRAYSCDFLKRCLEKTGFKKINIYNGYSFEKYSPLGERILFVCKKGIN